MNSCCHSSLARCYSWVVLILLAGVLTSCRSATPSSITGPSLSVIHVVMDDNYPPYVFKDDSGQVQGILIDQWKLWEERTGVQVDITALPWGEALRRMQAGEFDVIDTIFYTGERARDFDFTPAYARIDVPIFFRNNISGIANARNLTGFRVAVKAGDANADYLISQGITDLAYYNSYEEIITAAARGEEVIFVIDQPPAFYFLYKHGLQDQFNHSTPLYSGEFHRAVKKDNLAVLNLVQDGFARISEAEYQAIDDRWLGTQAANAFQQIAPYVAAGAAIALLLILILVVFSRALQHRVGQRTQELEQALQALRESRRFLADLIEYSGALIFVKDLDGRYELINRKWEEVTGLKREDVIGQTDEVLFPGPIGRQFRANDREVIESGTVLEREELLEDAQGKRFFISIKFPVWDEAGHMKSLCGMTTEITERKRAEEALKESERALNRSQAIAQVGHWTWDTRANRVTWSAQMYHIFGIDPDTLAGNLDEIIEAAIHPEDKERVLKSNEAVLTEQKSEALEYRVVWPDGTVRHVWAQPGDSVLDETGQIVFLFGVVQDITERKRAEEALHRSEDKFSKAFHISPDAISINRLSDSLFIEINQGFTAMMGYTAEDVTDKTMEELTIWANPADRTRLLQSLLEHGLVSNQEVLFRRKDGWVLTGLISARLIEVGGENCIIFITRDITDRKQAEEALRESEEKFRAMIEQASEGFALIDEDGLLIEWNHAQERILGLMREEVLGRPIYDVQFQLLPPDQRTPERYETLKATMLGAWPMEQLSLFSRLIEAELYRPDGQRVFVQQGIFPIKTRQGYRLGAISLDITERKRADAALNESEQKMRAIVDAAPFGAHLYELEPEGRLVFKGANHSADQILHVDHQQFIGKTIEDAFPPLVETEIPAAYRRVAATGEPFQLDQIAYDDSGIRGAYELHAFQTGPHQMAVFFRDVTERKQMEEALRISLEKYRVLFESFPLGISIMDSAGKILETNLQAEKLLGVPKQEHEQRTYDAPEWKFVRADGIPMPVEEYASTRAMRENRLIQNIDMGFVKDQGAITWLSVTAAPIPLKGYGVAVAYGDITRHKEIEDEIRRLNEDLEQRVIERTRELAEANVRLTEFDQLKSKFVSDVSHELRTPIANLKLYVDLLERGKPEKQSHYITVLQQQVRRVMALVDDILDLSRLERRKEQGVIYQAVALNEVVNQVVLAHQPRAEADGLLLTFAPAPELPFIHGDANQLAQVVTNLVANALSYTTAGYIRVSTYMTDKRVCLSVSDNGSGIDAEDLPHIFERFYRGQRVLKNDVPGTGLGLAIVKEIVDLHHGSIEVESQPGQGTTFRVWLPIVQGA